MDRESQAATFMRWLMRRYTSGYIEIRMLNPGHGPQLSYHQIPRTDAQWSELAQMCVDMFRREMPDFAKLAYRLELRGKNLACFCPLDQPCHADVLLELANSPEGTTC